MAVPPQEKKLCKTSLRTWTKPEENRTVSAAKNSTFSHVLLGMTKPPAPLSNNVSVSTPQRNIKELAKLPRGKAWASRLCAFEDAIRAQRKAHKSYREIAAWLDTQGLRVSPSSVHGFVKARAQRKRPLYALPEPTATLAPATPTLSPSPSPSPTIDPLDFDAPRDPDAENPFKMRKRADS